MGRFDITRKITLARAGVYSIAVGLLLLSSPVRATVDTDLSVGGGVRIGWASDTCAAGIAGAIRYNSASSGTVDLCNGSNWITVGPGGGSSTFLSLTDTPATYAGSGGYFLKVNSGATAVEFSNQIVASGAGSAPVGMVLDNLDDVVITAAANGECLTYNGTNWVDSSCGGGGGTPAGADREIQFNSGGAFGASSTYKLMADGDLLLTGTYTGTASVPATGAGTRLFFDTQKAAFRVGNVTGTQWDNASIGNYSVAMGGDTNATGSYSVAMGGSTNATGGYSVAMGFGSSASGGYSVAMGFGLMASGQYSTAMGASSTAAGDYSTVFGREVSISAAGDGSAGFGLTTTAPATDPIISGAQSLGVFMGNHSGINFASANTLGLFGGTMVIDPKVPATQLSARGVLDVGAATDAIVFPSGTTAQRPATPVNGMTRYNSTTAKFEAYQAGAWVDMIGGGGGGSIDALSDGKTDYVTDHNLWMGNNAGNGILAGGQFNTVVGENAGDVISTGDDNAGFGYNVLGALTTGMRNTGMGSNALSATTGDHNTGIGYFALKKNVDGGQNTAIGAWAMAENVSVYNNTAVGYGALEFHTTGSGYNTAMGREALGGGSNLTDNVAFGGQALVAAGTGGLASSNAAVGTRAMQSTTIGDNNVAVGIYALHGNVAMNESTAVGYFAMRYGNSSATSTVTYNTAVGAYALQGSTTASANTGINNTAVGHSAMLLNTTGTSNAAVGTSALQNSSTGNNNAALGAWANLSNTSGSDNVAVGSNSLRSNTIGYSNVAVGSQALYSNVAKRESVAIGLNAMQYADSTVTGATTYNTAIGSYALQGSATASANTGTANTAIGHSALLAVTSGSGNIAIGDRAADALTTGSNNITIGSNIDAVSATGSNQLNIGNTIYGDLSTDKVGVGVVAPSYALDVFGTIRFSSSMIMGSISGAAAPVTSSVALNDLSDVVITAAANGECLTYNGTNWVDGSCGGGGGTPAGATREIQFNSGGAFGASSNFKYMADGDLLLVGTHTGTASVPVTGAGTRMFFDVQKSAFRAGRDNIGEWNNANIGDYSVAMGGSAQASGIGSVALGGGNITSYPVIASGTGAIAAGGNSTTASGAYSVAMGYGAIASNLTSVALGNTVTASGQQSVAIGSSATASSNEATAIGSGTTASGSISTAIGFQTTASGSISTAMGYLTTASGYAGLTMGRHVIAGNGTAGSGQGDGSMAIGLIDDAVTITTRSQVTGIQSMGIFMGDQDGLVFASANTLGLFGGTMVIDPKVPATQLSARGVLDVGAATDAIVFPSGTTAQRPATPVNGMTRYNSTTAKFEAYQAGAWVDMIGGGGGGSIDGLSDGKTDYVTDFNLFLGTPADAWAIAAGGRYNLAIGQLAGDSITTSDNNIAIGYNALTTVTTLGGYNVAIGKDSLQSLTSGADNVAVGDNTASASTTAYGNIAIGSGALSTNVARAENTAVGFSAMLYADSSATSSVTANTAIGAYALRGSTTASANTGNNNTAVGHKALNINTTGNFNSAFGVSSMGISTTGSYNAAFGRNSLGNNGGGNYNTGLGASSLFYNTSGNNNTAVGFSALHANSAKQEITAVGYNAMQYADSTTTASIAYNTAVGAYALQGSTTASANTGVSNTAVGHSAMQNNTTGTYNTAIGHDSMKWNTTGGYNTAVGQDAMLGVSATPLTGSFNTAVGVNALYIIQGAATNNTALGENALQYNTTGSQNTAVGVGALQSTVGTPLTGTGNTAVGKDALLAVAGTAASNTAVGQSALKANTTASGSTAVGFEALMTTVTGVGSTAVGYQALKLSQTTGIDNTAIGYQALQRNTTGDYNNAFGRAALEWNTTGSANLAIGSSALGGNATGNNNVAVGVDALGAVDAGNNTAVGYQAGYAGTALTTGTNNTFIGYQAQANANNYTNGTALGNGAVLTASNRIVLGNTAIASIYAQVTSITAISDRRHKKDIEELGLGLDFIRKLQPVSYRFNNGDETLRYGFIAQDVEKALSPELQALVEKADDKNSLALLQKENNAEGTYRVNYGELTSPIIKAIQEQQVIIDTQRTRIDEQEARIEQLSKDIQTKMTSFEKDLNGLKAHTGYGVNKAQIGIGVLVGMGAGMALIFFFGPALRNRQRKAE